MGAQYLYCEPAQQPLPDATRCLQKYAVEVWMHQPANLDSAMRLNRPSTLKMVFDQVLKNRTCQSAQRLSPLAFREVFGCGQNWI
jgi:hypothetical protein